MNARKKGDITSRFLFFKAIFAYVATLELPKQWDTYAYPASATINVHLFIALCTLNVHGGLLFLSNNPSWCMEGDRIREWCAQRSHGLPVPSTNPEFVHALSDTNYRGERMSDRGYQPKTERGEEKEEGARCEDKARKDGAVKKEAFEGEKEVIHFWITNHKTACDALLSRRHCPGGYARQEAKSEV